MPWTEWDDNIEAEQRQAQAVACNDAFVKAMTRAIRYRREKVTAGTFVDTTPPIHARRLQGTVPMSACSSPAAACLE